MNTHQDWPSAHEVSEKIQPNKILQFKPRTSIGKTVFNITIIPIFIIVCIEIAMIVINFIK